MKFLKIILYVFVISSASPNTNNLHGPTFNLEDVATSKARSTHSGTYYKAPLPSYSDAIDLNPPSYEKAIELKNNEQSTVIQINYNNNADDRENINCFTSFMSALGKACCSILIGTVKGIIFIIIAVLVCTIARIFLVKFVY